MGEQTRFLPVRELVAFRCTFVWFDRIRKFRGLLYQFLSQVGGLDFHFLNAMNDEGDKQIKIFTATDHIIFSGNKMKVYCYTESLVRTAMYNFEAPKITRALELVYRLEYMQQKARCWSFPRNHTFLLCWDFGKRTQMPADFLHSPFQSREPRAVLSCLWRFSLHPVEPLHQAVPFYSHSPVCRLALNNKDRIDWFSC